MEIFATNQKGSMEQHRQTEMTLERGEADDKVTITTWKDDFR